MQQVSPGLLNPGGGSGPSLQPYLLGRGIPVPASGILYLAAGPIPTSAVGIRIGAASQLARLSIQVDQADGGQDYRLVVLKNGVSVATLALPAAAAGAHAVLSPVSFIGGDRLAVYVERTSGVAASAFQNILAVLVFSE